MTNIIHLLSEDKQENFKKDKLKELNRITNAHSYQEILAELNATNMELINIDHKLRICKHAYETDFANLCTSPEYMEEYKTVKAREQMATIELSLVKKEILELEKEKQILRYNKQGLEYELKYLLKGVDGV